MARIYRKTDRIAVKIDDISIKLAPLSIHQKVEIQNAMVLGRINGDLSEQMRGIALSLKYSVKGVEGLQDSDGNPYQLKFEGENLSDESVDDLMNIEISKKLTLVCAGILNGIPDEFSDQYGNKIEGVELIKTQKEDAPKNV
jgi:uncharacterized protein YfkK (UPF0435 family)